jgi:hypothetical protein
MARALRFTLLAASLLAVSSASSSCSDERQFSGTLFVDSGPPPRWDADVDQDESDDAAPQPDGDPICEELDLPVIRVTPKVLIVLDRSNSMLTSGHWNPVREALIDLTARLEKRLAFGLMVFPEFEGSHACTRSSESCSSPREPTIRCEPRNASKIERLLEELDTCGGTPTAPTLDAALGAFLEIDSPIRVPEAQSAGSYVLLATDGAPNCNDELDGETCRCTGTPAGCAELALNCLDAERTYGAIDRLADLDIQIFVLGILVSRWRDVLDEMARRGGTGQASMAEAHDEIYERFDEITRDLTTCEVAFRDPGPVADPTLVNFYINGRRVPLSDGDMCGWGWRWSDESHRRVTFCGPYCELLRDGLVDEVIATFGCPSLI